MAKKTGKKKTQVEIIEVIVRREALNVTGHDDGHDELVKWCQEVTEAWLEQHPGHRHSLSAVTKAVLAAKFRGRGCKMIDEDFIKQWVSAKQND